jgi:threonine-phosphate decarboxylase
VVRGWAQYPGDRHHGAHGDLVSRSLDVHVGELLDFSQNINPLGAPGNALVAARRSLYEDSGRYPDLEYTGLRGALAAGMKPVRTVVRRREEGLRWDPTALGDLEGISVVFLCNPNNPTGDSLGRGEVLEVAARVQEAGAVLVVDEAFADFVPGISVTDMVHRGLWVARSFTKFFAIPGLRLGCLVCDDAGRIQALQPSWPVNAVAAAAGIAAVGDRDFAQASIAEVTRLREDLFRALDALPGLQPFPGAANFLLVRGPEELPGRLARRGVLVRGCGPFHGLGPEYFRVAVRDAEENGRLVAAIREEL